MERRSGRARRLVALASMLFAAGCASIAAGGPDMVPVSSSPEGARVSLDGVPVGRTPCIIAFDRACEGVVKLELPGHATAVVDRDKVMNGWFVGNLLWFGGAVVAFPIDLLLHNQGKYSTAPVFVELSPVTPSN
jgi:hypothetical protein